MMDEKMMSAAMQFLLTRAPWAKGTQQALSFLGAVHGKVPEAVPILSLNVAAFTAAQIEASRTSLQQFGLNPVVTQSASMGDVPVLRLSRDDVWKFNLAQQLARPEVWAQNSVVGADGTERPALNLRIEHILPDRLQFIEKLLEDAGVPCKCCFSSSLGGVQVLRVTGAENIERLSALLGSGLPKPAIPEPIVANSVPPYPSDTHCHTVSSGRIMVRRREPDGSQGKLDNPVGPAVISGHQSVYALDGQVIDRDAWKSDPRVANLQRAGHQLLAHTPSNA